MTTISLTSMQTDGLAPRFIILCIVLAIFEMIMKGISMYKAGTRKQIARFVCLFIFNTCGILPIIYLILNKKEN